MVYDSRGPIAFGSPCDWASGVASRVLSHELRLATVHFKKEEALDAGISVEIPLYAIENAGKIFLDYKAQTAQGGRQTQEDRYMCEPDMDKNSAAYPKLCKIGLPTLSFFAVYDGHGGEAAAEVSGMRWCSRSRARRYMRPCLCCACPCLTCLCREPPGPADALNVEGVGAQYLREKLHKSFADALGDQAHVNRAAPRGRRSRVCIKAAIRDAFKVTDEQICSREREIRGCGEKRQNVASCAGSAGAHVESSGAAAVAGVIYGQVQCVVERRLGGR